MKKKNFLLLLIITLIFYIEGVFAYSINSSNNPGVNYNENSSGLSGTTTIWPSPYLHVVRIRIFRGNTVIASSYYSIVNSSDKCYGSLTDVKLCETDEYEFSSVTSSDNVSCKDSSINFGCIASSNLSKSWDVDSYNGTYLDNYLKNSQYTNLKEILLGMGYNNTNYNNEDVIIVEPATLVRCAGNNYFGTSTSLMKKNISYRGSSGNVCSSNDSFSGYTFNNLFLSMSKAFKVRELQNCSNSDYSQCGYFLYNVSGMGYDPKGGKIEIRKYKEGTSNLITSSNSEFKIYNSTNCTGTVVDTVTTSGGIATTKALTAGTYSIYESSVPTGYVEPSNRCVVSSVVVTEDNITTQNVYNKPNCKTQLDALGTDPTISQLLDLFKIYPSNTNLLNFSNPSCTANDNCKKTKESNITGCLSATGESSLFNSYNLSCFDEAIQDAYGNYITFCKTTLNLENNLGVNKFYSKSGQFLIKKISENIIQIYDENLNPVEIHNSYIATAEIEKNCYVLNGNDSSVDSTLPQLKVYFNDDNKELDSDVTSNPQSVEYINGFTKYKYSSIYNYKLNSVYVEKITGEVFEVKKNNFSEKIDGVVSNFTKTSGSIYFNVVYDGKTSNGESSNICSYESENEIIIDNKLFIEFRTIDTTEPFNRAPNSNWCNKESECTEDDKKNQLVEDYILNRTNSYGFNRYGEKKSPIYEITLDSSDIQAIRLYNKQNKYDSYILTKDLSGNYVNAFLYDLKNGILNQYDDNGELESQISILNHKLLIN